MSSDGIGPTEQAYTEFSEAYDFYNERLFNARLPGCLFTMQRKAHTYGYFSSKRFVSRAGRQADEIALNPEVFAVVPLVEILQTLVHEMTHQWQQHFGTPGRRRYHNKEWGDMMESVGLMPSHTGQPGGRKTGEQMMDYVIEGGPFDRATRELVAGDFGITWLDRFPAKSMVTMTATVSALQLDGGQLDAHEELPAADPSLQVEIQEPNRSNRWKYTCPGCGVNAWGKPKLNLKCGDCDEAMNGEQ